MNVGTLQTKNDQFLWYMTNELKFQEENVEVILVKFLVQFDLEQVA